MVVVVGVVQVPKRIGQVGLIFGHDGEQVRKAMEATHALRDAAWINLTPTGTRTTLHVSLMACWKSGKAHMHTTPLQILEVLKRWCYKRTGVIINFATIGEAACGKSTGNAAMIKEYRSVVIGMGDKVRRVVRGVVLHAQVIMLHVACCTVRHFQDRQLPHGV